VKRRDLIRTIEKFSCVLVRSGGKHDWYRNQQTGVAQPVPRMACREQDVVKTLTNPDEVRRSRVDPAVHHFYRLEQEQRWVCAVCKRLNGDGFLVTAYPTDAIKEGDKVWPA